MTEAESLPDIEPEEAARALWYAIVSRLFYAPPDQALLDGLATVGEQGVAAEGNPFLETWQTLRLSCREVDPEAVREEFETLFVGVGRAPVTPYTAAYAASHAPDRHLLELRTRLGEWQLGRRERVFETEDHVSAVCDSMRWLIEQGRPIEEQRAFFEDFVDRGIPAFCAAINRSPLADFYRQVGSFTQAFLSVERAAFDMHTTT